MATIATMAAAGLAMAVFVMLANLVVIQYGRGVARSAVDEAVRRGSTFDGSVERCRDAGEAVLSDLLGGPVGSALSVECVISGRSIIARVDGPLRSITPFLPDTPVGAESSAPVWP